jgi:hypothetical protein
LYQFDLDRVVRGSVEEALSALLDTEADRMGDAQRFERARPSATRHFTRYLQTKAGEESLRASNLW